jgi:lysozyme
MTIQELILKHEGLRLFPYTDTVGKLTIGVGRNLIDRGITKDEALVLLDNDIKDFTAKLKVAIPWFDTAPDKVKLVLIDMAFNMGIAGLLQFKNTLEHIRLGQYNEAAEDMLKSLWAKQVGVRAIEDSNLLKQI